MSPTGSTWAACTGWPEVLGSRVRPDEPVTAPAPPRLDTDALIDDRRTRIIVCCGSGGVGKTTAAAAIGPARRRTRPAGLVVLTVDPARRLAQSMGLTYLDNIPRPVDGSTPPAAAACTP